MKLLDIFLVVRGFRAVSAWRCRMWDSSQCCKSFKFAEGGIASAGTEQW